MRGVTNTVSPTAKQSYRESTLAPKRLQYLVRARLRHIVFSAAYEAPAVFERRFVYDVDHVAAETAYALSSQKRMISSIHQAPSGCGN
jgi:hypothetical protein